MIEEAISNEMQRYYALRAPGYDSSMQYDDPETVKALSPVAAALVREFHARRVLEIACGPCFWTRYMSEVANSVLATDYNETSLLEARKKDLPWDKISLRVLDAYRLSSLEAVFDGAYSVDWLAHVPRTRLHEFLRGLHSCLQDRARVAFCDQHPRDTSVTGNFDSDGNNIQERILPNGFRFRVIKHYFTDEEYLQILSPYSDDVRVQRFPELRRVIASYTLQRDIQGVSR